MENRGLRPSPLWLAAGIVCLAVLAPWAQAQNIKGSLRGVVRDSQGGVLPGAAVAAEDQGQNAERRVKADEAGRFSITALDPGRYVLRANHPDFVAFESEEFAVQTGDSLRFEIVLQPEGGTVSIEVRSTPSVVSQDDAKLARGFSGQEMEGLPVLAGGTGRNFYAQALTAPGVALSTQAHRPFAVSGQRPRNNTYLIDSGENNDVNSGFIAGRGVTEQLISQEAVASFEILTHNFKAEYGRNSGSVVSLVSKSGSNDLHGSLFWFHNNSALAARNFFEDQKTSRRSNLAGFAAGGPVKRDRAFWFANYETFRPRGGTLARFQTLTAPERARAAASVQPLVALYPARPAGSGCCRQPFRAA